MSSVGEMKRECPKGKLMIFCCAFGEDSGATVFSIKKIIMKLFTSKNNKNSRSEKPIKNQKSLNQKSITLFFFAVLLASTTWQSCDLEEEPIPSYIQIDTVLVTTNGVQGSASHKISAVQVAAGAQSLGIFPLPATIPVLEYGIQNIVVDPIVVESGISAIRELYPFYTRYTTTGDLTEGEVLQVNPQVTYNSDANFVFVENFDGGNSFVDDLDGDPGTRIEVSFDDVFEGSGSGKITLNETGSQAFVGTGLFYTLPTSGERVYLEMNYKCNTNFTIGFRAMQNVNGATVDVDILTLIPREEWNKIYVSLNQEASASNGDRFQIYIKMAKSDDVGFSELVMDNIKLIHQ